MVINDLSNSRGFSLTAAILAAAGCVGLAGTASATAITVLNPDFSSPTTSTWVFGGTAVPAADSAVTTDWGIDGYAGVTSHFYSQDPTGQIPNLVGTQAGVVDTAGDNTTLTTQPDNSSLYQDVGALQPNTTYSLTVYTGFSNGYITGEFGVLELVNGTSDAGSVLNSVTYTPSTAWPYPFEDVSLSYSTGSAVSGDLTLVLGVAAPAGGDQIGFNNVQLTATPVPEPAALGTLAAGGIGLLLVGRNRAVCKRS